MKKTLYIISCSLLILGGISCQKEKIASGAHASQDPIEFSVETCGTKGQKELNHEDELVEQDFSVSAWYSAEGEEFRDGATHYIANHRFGTLDNKATWRGIARSGSEKTPDPVFYPLAGDLSFFCYAPYRDPAEFQDITIDDNPPEGIKNKDNYLPGSPVILFSPESSAARQIDFVAAEPILNWSKSDGIVPLDFTKHMTTKLQFWCKYEGIVNDEEKVMIDNIQIGNVIGSEYLYFTDNNGILGHQWCSDVPPEGSTQMPLSTYSLSIENHELKNGADAYLATDIYKFVNSEITGKVYLLPQKMPARPEVPEDETDEEVSFPYLQISYIILNEENKEVEKNTLKYDLRGTMDWPEGKTVAYEITVNVAQRKMLVVNSIVIKPWEDAGNQHTEEEILY